MIVPVDCRSGLVSFEAEAIATEQLLKVLPHIKSVDDLTSRGSWDTVMANKMLRIGSHTPATKVFISLGFGLKDSLAAGTIKVNTHGKVQVNPQQATEHKPLQATQATQETQETQAACDPYSACRLDGYNGRPYKPSCCSV